MRLLLLLALICTPMVVLTQEYSHGDPTAEEQQMLEMINRARMDPTAEGVRLMDTDDPSVQQSYTYWNIDKAKTKTAFAGYQSRPPLAFHPALIQAARLHSADMAANNFQGHVGSNGSQLDQRLAAQGYTSQGQYGENVAAYASSVWFGHCGFNVDWGTENQVVLGHRSNIMNFNGAVYTEIGVGIQHTNGGLGSGTVGPLVITEDFGMRSVRYITGVVYDDKNHNGFYDVGEGLAGVQVKPSRGATWATTSTSGGYAFPFSGSGGVTVTASGGDLGSPIVVTTSFEGNNLKVDFVPAAQTPGVVVLTTPANNAKNVDPKTVVLLWQKAAFAESYQVQIATASAFTPASIVYDNSASGITADAPTLPCGKVIYWRVRGINTLGEGSWSAVSTFTTSGTSAGAANIIGPKGTITLDNMGNVSCTWNKASDAERYHIRFASNSSFTQVFSEDSAVTTNAFELPTSALPPSKTFYWSVRAGNDCGWGPWSGTAIVTYTVTDVADHAYLDPATTVFPNPVTASSKLISSVTLCPGTRLAIVDALGTERSVTTVREQTTEVFIGAMVASLPTGAYTIVITSTAESTQQISIAVVR